MKLKGIRITNTGSLRKHFDLKELWGNVDNGVLLEFEAGLRETGDAGLSGEICRVLENICSQEFSGPGKDSSKFYHGEEWNLECLHHTLEPFSRKSLDHTRTDFFLRNQEQIRRFVTQPAIAWNEERTVIFYLFLLLMLQARPREMITEEEFCFIRDRISSWEGHTSGPVSREKNTYIYPCASGCLFLENGTIYNDKKQPISPEEETILDFAYTDELGIIAITADGRVSACTDGNIRYELGNKCAEERLAMISACGSLYIILTEAGNIVTNAEDDTNAWKDIRWVNAGLNSLAAVRGKTRGVLQLGMDSRLTEYSDVQAVYTANGGQMHFMILKTDGSLMMDDGQSVQRADAASLYGGGYLYAADHVVYRREFHSTVIYQWKLQALEECTPVFQELCHYGSQVYYRCQRGEKTFFGQIRDQDFQKAEGDHI